MEPILSRVSIAERAYADAVTIAAGQSVANPYPVDSEAAKLWNLTVQRYLTDDVSEAA